jgi:uncharacterized protein YegL
MAKKKAEKKNKLVVALLLDESGSMSGIKSAALSAVNEYIESMKKDYVEKPELGEIYLSLITFSDKYGKDDNVSFIYNLRNITEVDTITDEMYKPQGGTPLLEAIGKAIESLDDVESRNPQPTKNPLTAFLGGSSGDCKFMMVIQTDGQENSWSPDYTKTKIQELIKEREEKGNWTFLFLGAGIDAIGEGMNIGVGVKSAFSFTGTSAGSGSYLSTYSAVASTSRSLRATPDMHIKDVADEISKLVKEED